MIEFLVNNSLYAMTALAVAIAVFTVLKWPSMPVLQRLTALQFLGVVAHVWEESRFPGGFTDLVTSKLGFTASNPHIGELFTAAAVLVLVFVPLLFPRITWLSMSAMFLGILEAVAHTGAIWLFKLDQFYSPGLLTAIFILLPISVYGVTHAVRHHLMNAKQWVFAVLYLLAPLLLAQRAVVTASGMPYTEFLKNIWEHF